MLHAHAMHVPRAHLNRKKPSAGWCQCSGPTLIHRPPGASSSHETRTAAAGSCRPKRKRNRRLGRRLGEAPVQRCEARAAKRPTL